MNPSPNGRWNTLQDRSVFERDHEEQERFDLSQAFAQPVIEDPIAAAMAR